MASSERKKSASDVFDMSQLTELIELMKEHGLTEVDLRQDKQQIRLQRGQVATATPAPVAAAPAPQASAPAPPKAETPENDSIVSIDSPMVGTFYGRPNPESEPFVKVGDRVSPDTVVCIIEAMKVFNEIPADVSGQVVEVLVGAEEAVDFGKPLFKVDTSK